MSNTELTTITDVAELDAVGAGRFAQFSVFNTSVGIQTAPTLNVALGTFGTFQAGAQQGQGVNSGNIA